MAKTASFLTVVKRLNRKIRNVQKANTRIIKKGVKKNNKAIPESIIVKDISYNLPQNIIENRNGN